MPYTVTLSPSGHSYACDSTVEVLKAGLDAGMFMPYSCRSGLCNTCRGKIVEGKVDYGDIHDAYLSEQDRAQGYALLCQAKPLSDLTIEVDEIDAGEAIRPKYMPARILDLKRAANDVMIVKLGMPMNEPTLFRAGQYVDFVRPDGVRRSYSIASTPTNDGLRSLELHMRHLPGGRFTDRVFGAMKVREMHKIEAPLGSFFLRDKSDKPMVMVASGTGFAPIKSMINDSLQRGFTRPITLYWGGRRREDLYMMASCEAWAKQHSHIRFVPVVSEATPQCAWTGRTGFVHRVVMEDFPDLSGHQVYACGAPVMVDSARQDFSAMCGLPAEEFFADAFLTEKEKSAA
ncbi:MAG: CDP-6-deoxy-delta-3,4-glucoseen reductase [Variovorax sp.]